MLKDHRLRLTKAEHDLIKENRSKEVRNVLVIGVVYDNVLYEHGEGGQSYTKAKNNMMSSVCGHTHTEAYVRWLVGKRFRVFSVQTGVGVNNKSYAAAYAKNFKKQAIGCAVVLNNGTLPINLLMSL
jgi:hypothetical protein